MVNEAIEVAIRYIGVLSEREYDIADIAAREAIAFMRQLENDE